MGIVGEGERTLIQEAGPHQSLGVTLTHLHQSHRGPAFLGQHTRMLECGAAGRPVVVRSDQQAQRVAASPDEGEVGVVDGAGEGGRGGAL